MHVMLIDDNAITLRVTSHLLRRMGHNVLDFDDPEKAVQSLPGSGVDMVVSDIVMPNLSGFDVAMHVAEALGTVPPRVLLISGYHDMRGRMDNTPPSVVIGVLPKPFSFGDLSRVVSLLDQARTRCPGVLCSFCPQPLRDEAGTLCESNAYSSCPHYDVSCGKKLRAWIWGQSTDPNRREPAPLIRQEAHPAESTDSEGAGNAANSLIANAPGTTAVAA